MEKDLLYFYANIKSFDEVQISQNKLNYYNSTLKRFDEIQGDEDFKYYKQRLSETVNQSDKIRYALIVWLYFKDITFFETSIMLLIDRIKLYLKIIDLSCFFI